MPIEVSYLTVGKKKTRNVTGIIFPTVLTQCIGLSEAKPICVEMGDVVVDWEKTSAVFEKMSLTNNDPAITNPPKKIVGHACRNADCHQFEMLAIPIKAGHSPVCKLCAEEMHKAVLTLVPYASTIEFTA